MAGLYIHIPFCKKACHYCDFHFSTQVDAKAQLCEALAQELALQAQYLSEPLETIYFGGGTPSLLTENDINLIFDSIHRYYKITEHAEVTLEANPDDLTSENLSIFKRAGINRLSIGVQSLDNEVLQFLNRSHNAEQAFKSIQNARNQGFFNINVDLIYAIPGRNIAKLDHDIEQLLALEPEHISAYSLTIEAKTVFGHWASSGKLSPETEDENAHQFEWVIKALTQTGFDHYEISNYARPGYQSQHNSSYWKQKKYLGIGPSAHSFNGTARQVNIANNHAYIRALAAKQIPATVETLSREDHINEYIMTSLRTMWGCDTQYLKSTYQYDIIESQKKYLNQAGTAGLLTIESNIIRLTHSGKMLADKIAADLFVVTD
jgi:oxygen-independent coproporphyrinogen III oxidase